MTIKEKVAQLGSQFANSLIKSRKLSLQKVKKVLSEGIGQITRIGGGFDFTPEEVVEIANEIQKFLKEETRLGIPAIIHEECLCGLTAKHATIFPQIIGLASTWEPELAESMTKIIREQMRVVGAHQGLSPVIDIARDPRWGRTEECFGEDPYLVARMGVSYIKGLQGQSFQTGIIATGKHYLGYGSSIGARNWGPAFIPKRELLEVFAKPFEAAIKEANLGSVMNAYHEIDGIPCGFSRYFLTDLLRDQFGFTGIVVSDYFTISLSSRLHRIASSPSDAAILALNAGLDVELPKSVGYGKQFVRAFKNGRVSEDVLNLSVRRILRKKFELGLFEKPIVEIDSAKISSIYNNAENKKLAKKIALKSIILLKNENNILPLKKDVHSIAVIGPSADSVRNMLGDYSFVSHFEGETTNVTGNREFDEETEEYMRSVLETGDIEAYTRETCDMKSILEVLKENVSSRTEVNYSKGCEILGEDKNGFEEAIELAKKSEIVVFVGGGKSGLVQDCTSGESRDRTSLGFPGVQEDLVRAIHATGTPIILVMINGRPLSISWEKENLSGIIEAWLPGEAGAEAVVEVLFGDYNPGGKLPISIPRNVGQIPIYHNIKPTGNISVWTWNYVEVSTSPLFPFGFGLSYTQFEYSNLELNKDKVNVGSEVEISLNIKNIGEFRGEEVAQLYVRDREADVTRPVEELVGFKRVILEPGESMKINFTLSTKQLGFYNLDMEYIIEPGIIDVYIASIHSNHGPEQLDLKDLFDKRDLKLKGTFEMIGNKTNIENEKVLFSKVKVERLP
jgi:beta-glucosidase